MRSSTGPVSARRWRRPFVIGFVVGAALVVPGVLVAMLVPAVERVWPFLTPGAALLSPLSGTMANWPGEVNLFLLATVNGLLVGAAAAGISLLLRRRRQPEGGIQP